jgi:tRNA 2-thiouridine synthesizing protein A
MVEKKAQIDKVLDVRGFSCPWCILKTKSILSQMEPGKLLEVLASDPQIIKDLPSVLKQRDDLIIRVDKDREVYRLYVRRGEQEVKGARNKVKPLYTCLRR